MLRKMCKILIVSICILTLTMPNASIVIAAKILNEDTNQVNKINLTAVDFREGKKESTGFEGEYDENSYKYIVNDSKAILPTTVLKIVDVEENSTSFDNAFYCLDGHANFPTSNGSIEYARTIPDFLKENPETLGISDENYNSICWLVYNMYLRNQMTTTERAEQKNELLTSAFKEILEDTSVEPITELNDIKSVITDDDIDFVQQWAMWYFTNHTDGEYNEDNEDDPVNNGYTFQRVPFTNSEKNLPLIDLQKESDEESDSMETTRRKWLEILYKYFVNNALENKNEKYEEEELNYPSIVELNPTCSVDGNNYKIGPFKVTKPSSDLSYELKLMDGNNEIPSSVYEIKTGDGQSLAGSINSIFNTEYYIYIPISGCTISEVNLKLNYKKYETRASAWQATDVDGDYQPVLLVTKGAKDVNENSKVEISGVFDLALQKYITKLNNTSIDDRKPDIKMDNGEIVYSHTDTPLNVKVGDKVEYTISVYNEGNIAGYASEICDDIPAGLIFNSSDETNIKYEWKMYDKDNNVTTDSSKAVSIRTTYLSKDSSQARNDDAFLEAFDYDEESKKGSLHQQDVKVVFEVDNTNKTKTIINTAEITNDSEIEGNSINDKDSTPDNDDANEDDIDQEKIKVLIFDLSLQKFITKVNGKSLTDSREPKVDVSKLVSGNENATYTTVKTPVNVKIGDKVTYKIRVYNEGDTDGYASLVSDFIPEGLGYLVEYKNNVDNCWQVPSENISMTTLGEINNGTENLKLTDFNDVTDLAKANVVKGKVKLSSNLLEKTSTGANLIKAFDGENLSYKDIEITCVVLSDIGLKNIAEIASDKNSANEDIIDRDSEPDTVDQNNYPGNDEDQDDNDVEYLTVTDFDLSLQKFITSVNDTKVTDRVPTMKYDNGKFTYTSSNTNPVDVKIGDSIEYTIRVYNEGNIDGYAKEVMDDIPEGLTFDANNETNKKYGWQTYDDGKKIKTDYLSKEKSTERNDDSLIKAFDKNNTSEISYKDLKVVFTVSADTQIQIITNTAEITNDSDKDGNDIEDRDSEPNNNDNSEDDIDQEQIKVERVFDLALQKFITEVNNKAIDDRKPSISYKDGKFTYTHPTTPLEVNSGDTVVYTINVYNEGELDGYAQVVSDDIPTGLIFDATNSVNKTYGWVMYDKDGNETTDYTSATEIRTDYLSKEKSQARGSDELIKAFDSTNGNISYATVKVAFTVSTVSKDETIINTAEIAEDADKDGNKIDDTDSTPNNKKDGEDDIDKERIHVGYFDLALKKTLAKSIVTENDKTTETEAKDGQMLKVEIYRKNINSTIVKFVYNISVTNEGTISGYATGIKDYIPDGLEFVEADNDSTWSKVSDGVIESKALEKTLINPGETKTIQVVLRWKNDENNLGVKKNVAEISSDKNDSNDVDDIDSTPDNKKDGEDDIDSAEVILTISTGKGKTYAALILIVSTITAGGVLIVKKFVM